MGSSIEKIGNQNLQIFSKNQTNKATFCFIEKTLTTPGVKITAFRVYPEGFLSNCELGN